MRACKRSDDAAVEEERRHGDRLLEQAAGILAEVEHEPPCTVAFERPQLAPEHDGRAEAERREMQHTPAPAGV